MESEKTATKNWAEEVDEEDEDAEQTIGNEVQAVEEKKEEEEKIVYNLPKRVRNANGDFIVTKVVIKEKELVAEEKDSDAEDESSEDDPAD
jgi:hypothetical protein